ncbi:hypothetical protein EVAR_5726_1 [Eumeta japonica]|uniref:Uncharacterized protein n=1 Tax=Eumeta variegata TaxID=151549 RepID=A0A4C1TA27_EUMVA|nr:hypothetical protein EVAR_5726_1 [Eumeta japonica]
MPTTHDLGIGRGTDTGWVHLHIKSRERPEAGHALVTPLGIRLSMGVDNHLHSDNSSPHLLLEYSRQ